MKVGNALTTATTGAFARMATARATMGGLAWRARKPSVTLTASAGVSARTGSVSARRVNRVNNARIVSALMTAMAMGSVWTKSVGATLRFRGILASLSTVRSGVCLEACVRSRHGVYRHVSVRAHGKGMIVLLRYDIILNEMKWILIFN